MDPEIGIMRRVLQEWRLFGALVPLSCALLGWSAGCLFSQPFQDGSSHACFADPGKDDVLGLHA